MTNTANATTTPTALTCPECGGAMREEHIGTLTQFRCHIGHVMTAEVLEAHQLETIEGTLASALRLLNEREALCREMAEREEARGNLSAVAAWRAAQAEALSRKDTMAKLAALDWRHPEETIAKKPGEAS